MVVDESILVSSASQVFSQSSTDARGTRARTRTWPPSCDGRSDAMRENSSPSGVWYNIANAMVVALSFAVGWLVGRKVGDGWVGGWLGWFMKVWMDGWLACGWCPGLLKGRFAWVVIEEFDGKKKNEYSLSTTECHAEPSSRLTRCSQQCCYAWQGRRKGLPGPVLGAQCTLDIKKNRC